MHRRKKARACANMLRTRLLGAFPVWGIMHGKCGMLLGAWYTWYVLNPAWYVLNPAVHPRKGVQEAVPPLSPVLLLQRQGCKV